MLKAGFSGLVFWFGLELCLSAVPYGATESGTKKGLHTNEPFLRLTQLLDALDDGGDALSETNTHG